MRRLLAPLLLLLAGCDQMDVQPRDNAYGRSVLLKDGMTNQAPPEGVLAREAVSDIPRPPITPALLERGRQRYAIACAMCHGEAGNGDGVVVSRGFPRPEPFAAGPLTSQAVVEAIVRGHGVMASHADRVAPADRWAIAAYVQALRLSQSVPAAELSPEDLAGLEAAHG